VYIDYLQNGHGRLLVAPLCVRPLPGAPVSMPLEWAQVNARLTLERFNMRTAAKWLRKHGDPLTGVLEQSIDMLAALESLAPRVAGRRSSAPRSRA
jgi:bifunctional non-homologous end joining protein LigD